MFVIKVSVHLHLPFGWCVLEEKVMKKSARNAEMAVFPVRLSNNEVSKEHAAHLAKLVNGSEDI